MDFTDFILILFYIYMFFNAILYYKLAKIYTDLSNNFKEMTNVYRKIFDEILKVGLSTLEVNSKLILLLKDKEKENDIK